MLGVSIERFDYVAERRSGNTMRVAAAADKTTMRRPDTFTFMRCKSDARAQWKLHPTVAFRLPCATPVA